MSRIPVLGGAGEMGSAPVAVDALAIPDRRADETRPILQERALLP